MLTYVPENIESSDTKDHMSLLDLRAAYLQVHNSLRPYQIIMYHSKRYCLTKLGFGLNVTLYLMKSIVKALISQLKKQPWHTLIMFVNEDVVPVSHIEHLLCFSIISKNPEYLTNGNTRRTVFSLL